MEHQRTLSFEHEILTQSETFRNSSDSYFYACAVSRKDCVLTAKAKQFTKAHSMDFGRVSS